MWRPPIQSDDEVIKLIIVETIFLCFMIFTTIVPEFLARKSVHAVSGLIMLLLDPRNDLARWFVYSVAVVSLVMTWELFGIPRFRFSKPRDFGVSVYLCIVTCWFYFQLPISTLAPTFFADPMGAIVGKAATRILRKKNPRWIGQKTVLGSAAVGLTIYMSLLVGPGAERLTVAGRIVISIMGTIAEGVGGDYDNLVLAAVVIPSRYYLAPWGA